MTPSSFLLLNLTLYDIFPPQCGRTVSGGGRESWFVISVHLTGRDGAWGQRFVRRGSRRRESNLPCDPSIYQEEVRI